MPRSGPIGSALNKALRSAPRAARDAAAVALAKRYAALLDFSAPARRYGKALEALRRVKAGALGYADDEAQAAFDVVFAALGEHSVASDLGPKFGALLVALELSPAGRRAAKGEESADVPSSSAVAGADELEQLRRERAGRQQHPAAVHPAAP